MNLNNRIAQLLSIIENKPWTVFIFFGILVFTLFRSLFGSYFEADEWVHFTYYLPLTGKPEGFLTAFISTFINTGFVTGEGQHINPVGTTLFFLNTKFFGINFPPYAFMSLLVHAVNSFLVFLLIRVLLHRKDNLTRNIFALLGGIFFVLAPGPIHTVTGAAAFYSSNVLSVTFFLLCIILFKIAFMKGQKKLIYVSIIFLFLALFSKETAVFLFLLLPFMAIIEKRIFPLKFLGKLFVVCAVVYVIFRFLIPNFLSSAPTSAPTKLVDTGTIVSRDLSIHKNLPGEIVFRTITFPLRLTGTLFFPRQTVFSIVQFITPIVQPVPPGGDSADSSQARLTFLYGPGNGFIIYIASLSILIFCVSQIIKFIRKQSVQEAQALATGLAIIILSSLPLVAIIFSFPRWGYDFYFDSRHYYNPNVGAAIVFPFLLFGIAKFVSKQLRIRKVSFAVFALFIIWLINNMNSFNLGIRQFTQNFQPDRREVVNQLKNYLPKLPQKAVFYIETDGLSAYGPILPFQTSVPQALTVIYYDKNPLPDSFFTKTLFDGKSQGYQYSENRGFGYYTSKKTLSEALLAGNFKPSDIYAFYYKSLKVEFLDKTLQVRKEMEDYLKKTDILAWKEFSYPLSKIKFLYPKSTKIEDLKNVDSNIVKALMLRDPHFNAEIFIMNVAPAFSVSENIQFLTQRDGTEKTLSFDKYHLNKATETRENQPRYFIKFDNMLIYAKIENTSPEGLKLIERILGSLEIINE